MNERTIWIVRIIGIAVILILLFLLMSLHSRLVRLNQEQQRPRAGSGAALIPGCGATGGEWPHA
ncbi:MAG: hypothetical protein HYU52_17495 [Acidobacteria bacterium]|nr:hypothetical protein [Acidobacteriota bacterium]